MKDHSFDTVLPLPTCRLGVRFRDDKLDAVVFLAPDTLLRPPALPRAREFVEAIDTWLETPQSRFPFELNVYGTPFQNRVWQAISAIPCGEIKTYGELCREAGGTPRAVGQACGANPFPIVVPCHRVVSKTGIGGFANARDGWLLDTKRWLLHHEGVL